MNKQPAKPFFAWFNEDVLGLDSEEYRRAFWREVNRTGHAIGHTPRMIETWQNAHGVHPAARPGEILFICLFVGGASLAFWFIREAIRRHLKRVRRPSYYAAERARRLALRLDPGCVPALANPDAVRTERTPRRLLGWLRRRRSA